MDYEAVIGLSRIQIRKLSVIIRKMLKVKTLRFPVLKAIDRLEVLYPDNIYYIGEERQKARNLSKKQLAKYSKYFGGEK